MMTGQRKWVAGFLCMAVLVSSAGCEPLRKKFTRQKKKGDVSNEIIPVLEPVEYPVKQHDAKEEYAQHYSLCKVWLSDFDTSRRQMMLINDKRMMASLDGALKEIDEMQSILKDAGKDQLAKIKEQVQWVHDEFAKPQAFRNEVRINSALRSVDDMMRKIKPSMVNFSSQ